MHWFFIALVGGLRGKGGGLFLHSDYRVPVLIFRAAMLQFFSNPFLENQTKVPSSFDTFLQETEHLKNLIALGVALVIPSAKERKK